MPARCPGRLDSKRRRGVRTEGARCRQTEHVEAVRAVVATVEAWVEAAVMAAVGEGALGTAEEEAMWVA